MFPVQVDYEKGIVNSGEPTFENAGCYLLWVRDTYIQDTPFTYQDIGEIHSELKRLRPERYFYNWHTIGLRLFSFIEADLIIVLDGDDRNRRNHTLMWNSYYRKKIVQNTVVKESIIENHLGQVLEALQEILSIK